MQRILILVIAGAGLLGSFVPAAQAATWAPTTGSFSWNTNSNWTSPATAPNGVGAEAIFESLGVTGNRVATLSAPTTVGSITFNNNANRSNTIGILNDGSTLTLDADGAGPLSATVTVTGTNNTGSNTSNNIFSNVVLNDNLIVDVVDGLTTSLAGELTFRGGTLSGPGGVTKNGTGTLTFADSSKSYTGPTIVNNGRFRLNATASITGTSGITVNPGGQFDIEGAIDYTFGTSPNVFITLNGFGLGPNSPIGYYPGAIRTGSSLTQIIENKIALASDASIDVVSNSGSQNGKLLLANEVSGPGRFVANQKVGLISREGFLYVGHSNSYTGGTTIEQGTLNVGVTRFQSAFPQSTDANLGTGNVFVDGVTPAFDGNPDGAASGKLVIESGVSNAIADTAYLNLSGGGTANTADRGYADLGTGINEKVGGLMLGGVIFGAGTYGSSTSGAANPGLSNPNEYFTGDGRITVVPTGVPGDYDNDGLVDARDYVLWRKGGPLAHDFTPGIQSTDFDFWRSRYGANSNPGDGSGMSESAVPEPSTIALAGFYVSLMTFASRRRFAFVSGW